MPLFSGIPYKRFHNEESGDKDFNDELCDLRDTPFYDDEVDVFWMQTLVLF